MLMELQDEARSPVLCAHPFFEIFREKFAGTTRLISHEALVQVTPVPGEFVFAEGDQCLSMYFGVTGHLRYVAKLRGAHGRVKRRHVPLAERALESGVDYFTEEG